MTTDSPGKRRKQERALRGHPYEIAKVAAFRRTRENWGGLSNMASGFPLWIGPIRVPSSEALYQACRFPDLPLVQHRIISQKSAMSAKMVRKPYEEFTREDWDQVRVTLMEWCLRVKLAQHLETFGDLLWATGDRPIVENSHKDDFWGAVPRDGSLIGLNVLGRLLMRLRRELISKGPTAFAEVKPPEGVRTLSLFGISIGTVSKGLGAKANANTPLTIPEGSLVRLWKSPSLPSSRPVLVNSTPRVMAPPGDDDRGSAVIASTGKQLKLIPAIADEG